MHLQMVIDHATGVEKKKSVCLAVCGNPSIYVSVYILECLHVNASVCLCVSARVQRCLGECVFLCVCVHAQSRGKGWRH